MDKIEEFINRRFKDDCNWTNGNCYYFAKILVTRFPHLKICYFPVEGHFMAGIPNLKTFYDFKGKHITSDSFVVFEDLKVTDNLFYRRLKRDCIF